MQNVYNAFQQLATQYQEHGGAVNTSTTPSVQYGYADGSANTVRPTSLTYPSGRVLNTIYNSGDDDALSRVSGLGDSSYSPLVAYTYLGLGSFVQLTYPQPGVTWTLITGAGIDPYGGLDQFGRVINNLWENSSGAALDEIQYTYDQASNRTSRKNVVAESLGAQFDELYGYDGMQRLKSFNRGTLVEAGGQLSALSLRQNWQLDATGNWTGFQNFDQTGATPALDQQRTSDTFNEITEISATVGATWVTPEYDRNGNMIVMPQPAAPTSSFSATYDAWNRLISLSLLDGASAAQYAYDGQNWQIYSSDNAFTNFEQYYSASWQLLEKQGVGPGDLTTYQFAWGLRYIDDLILRDTLELQINPPRYYALQDANWNMDAIVDAIGAVQERYSYTAYGVVTFLDPDFTPRGASLFAWETLYAGYRWDYATGLYLARNRWLHPLMGVWTTPDPLLRMPPWAKFLYTACKPLIITDPFGLAGCSFAARVDVPPTCRFSAYLYNDPNTGAQIRDATFFASFSVAYTFAKPCGCCEFRQYAMNADNRITLTLNGTVTSWVVPSAYANEGDEDCIVNTAGFRECYGRKNKPNKLKNPTDAYSADACKYYMSDRPGIDSLKELVRGSIQMILFAYSYRSVLCKIS